jgi:hypothetical protein
MFDKTRVEAIEYHLIELLQKGWKRVFFIVAYR